MKKITILSVVIALMVCLCLAGCAANREQAKDEDHLQPTIIEYAGDPNTGYPNTGYRYIVDGNTGVVYLRYDGYYDRCEITVLLNRDGTPVTAEQLDLKY